MGDNCFIHEMGESSDAAVWKDSFLHYDILLWQSSNENIQNEGKEIGNWIAIYLWDSCIIFL